MLLVSFRSFLAVLLLTGVTVTGYAQSLLSVTTAPEMPVVRIDPVTGATQTVVATNTTGLSFSFSTYDPVRRRLFALKGSPIGAQSLVIVELDTLAVTIRPIPNAAAYLFLEYDRFTDRIFSVTSAPGLPVVAIDPDTGVTQTLFHTGVASAGFSISALDPVGRQLYFLTGSAGSQSLVAADLLHETATTTPIPIAGAAYLFFEWDPVSHRLVSVTTQPGFPLVSIDPANGAIQVVGPTAATTATFGMSAIDFNGRHLFFLSGSVGAQSLFVVDLDDGSASTVGIALPVNYMLFEFEYSVPAVAAEVPLDPRVIAMLAIALAVLGVARLYFAATP